MKKTSVFRAGESSAFLCGSLSLGLLSSSVCFGFLSGSVLAAEVESNGVAEVSEISKLSEAPSATAPSVSAAVADGTDLESIISQPSSQAVPQALPLAEPFSADDIAQVTGVSELSDVQPSDWAFTALQRLVEEYGCLEGYPDRTFRGNRALTRYEFAAGLNACLDVVVQLIGPDTDLDSVRRLQEEFAAELAVVRSRVDTLETDVAELRDNQFSTTTKFSGQVFAHLNYATASGDIRTERAFLNNPFAGGRDGAGNPLIQTVTDNPAPTFTYLAWLNFATSFTGKDRLQLQLPAGDGSAPANVYTSAGLLNTYGTPFTLSRVQQDNIPVVRELYYSFPVGDQFSVTIGPRVNWYRHFDNNRFTFFVTGANSFNSSGGTQVNAVDRGAGVVVQWDLAD